MTLPEINPGSIDPYSGKSKVTGFCIFASYDVIKNKFLTLSGEAGYVRKGFKYNTETQNGNGEITGKGSIKNSFSYIDLSANVKFILRKRLSVLTYQLLRYWVYILEIQLQLQEIRTA